VRRSLEVLLHKESPCKVHFLFWHEIAWKNL
jgi:hypothetical protein